MACANSGPSGHLGMPWRRSVSSVRKAKHVSGAHSFVYPLWMYSNCARTATMLDDLVFIVGTRLETLSRREYLSLEFLRGFGCWIFSL